MTDQVPLPYRALTEENPVLLGKKIQEALDNGYVAFGEMRHAQRIVLVNGELLYKVYFVQLVIDLGRVQIATGKKNYGGLLILNGKTDRAFCEMISGLLTQECPWKIFEGPTIYLEGDTFMLCQQLVR